MKGKKIMGCEQTVYLEKKKNVRYLTNRGIEAGIDYVGKKQKNHGVGMNCVFGRRRKMMGFGRTVDLKLVEIRFVKGRKIMG